MFDRDILIYVLSQLMAAKNEGQEIGRRVRGYRLMTFSRRPTDTRLVKPMQRLRRALTRLQFTQIETNIHDAGIGEWSLDLLHHRGQGCEGGCDRVAS